MDFFLKEETRFQQVEMLRPHCRWRAEYGHRQRTMEMQGPATVMGQTTQGRAGRRKLQETLAFTPRAQGAGEYFKLGSDFIRFGL